MKSKHSLISMPWDKSHKSFSSLFVSASLPKYLLANNCRVCIEDGSVYRENPWGITLTGLNYQRRALAQGWDPGTGMDICDKPAIIACTYEVASTECPVLVYS